MPTQDPGHPLPPPDILLQMDLQPSSLLRGSLVLSHLLAMFSLWWIDANILLQLAVTAGLALSCRRYLRRSCEISCLQMRPGEILIGQGDQMIPVVLKDAPWCSDWLQVLRFAVSVNVTERGGTESDVTESGAAGSTSGGEPAWRRFGQRRLSVVILPDSASAQSRRRLRVLLRWHSFSIGVPTQAGSDNNAASRGSRMVSFASGSKSG